MNGIAIFTTLHLIVSGAVLLLIWLSLSIIPALVEGKAPTEVWSYTTVITYAIDIATVIDSRIAQFIFWSLSSSFCFASWRGGRISLRLLKEGSTPLNNSQILLSSKL